MTGNCENCANAKNCTKDIGFIWGFCNTDFVPKDRQKDEKEV